jgi:hypothetical protein
MDFEQRIGQAQSLKEITRGLSSKFLEVKDYVRDDIRKVEASFGNQTAGNNLRIALEDASLTLETASADVGYFGTEADKMIALLR